MENIEDFELKATGIAILLACIVLWFYAPIVWSKYKLWRGSLRERRGILSLLALNTASSLSVVGEHMRKRAADRVVADRVCDQLEDAHHKGEITKRQKRHYEKQLSLIWPDLLLRPRGIRLKQTIIDRRELTDKTPVNIPGPKPGDKTTKTRGKFTVVASGAK